MNIILTRPEPQAQESAAKLEALGHRVILSPVLSVVSHPFDAARLRSADVLVITSITTITHLEDADLAAFAEKPVFAVGQRTSEAARQRGLGHCVSADGNSDAIHALVMATKLPEGVRIAMPGGTERAGDLAVRFAEAGYVPDEQCIYRARPVPEMSEAALAGLRGGQVGCVLHYSPRSAQLFLAQAERAGLMAEVAAIEHFALSAAIASRLATMPAGRVHSAARPREDALLSLLP